MIGPGPTHVLTTGKAHILDPQATTAGVQAISTAPPDGGGAISHPTTGGRRSALSIGARLVRRHPLVSTLGVFFAAGLIVAVLVLTGGGSRTAATGEACFTTSGGQKLCGQAAASFCAQYTPANTAVPQVGAPAQELQCLEFTEAQQALAMLASVRSDPTLRSNPAIANMGAAAAKHVLQHAEQSGIYVESAR